MSAAIPVPRRRRFFTTSALVAIGLLAHFGRARAGSIEPGEYSANYKAAVEEDRGGQDCVPEHTNGTFAFGVHLVDGAYVLVPRVGFPLGIVIHLTQNGASLTGTDDVTSVFLSFKGKQGKQVTGTIVTDRRCQPVYTFKGAWKGSPRAALPPAPLPVCTSDPSTCSGETICLDNQCVAAFGRVYTIVVMGATIPQFKPDGKTWDLGDNPPDPFAVITLNDKAIGATAVAQDTITPQWGQATQPMVIPAGSVLRIDVIDKDAASDDQILSCSWPLTADVLHAGMASCSGQLGGVGVMFSTQ